MPRLPSKNTSPACYTDMLYCAKFAQIRLHESLPRLPALSDVHLSFLSGPMTGPFGQCKRNLKLWLSMFFCTRNAARVLRWRYCILTSKSLFTRIILSTVLAKFRQICHVWQIATVSQILSNLPFSALHACLDISEYVKVFSDVNISLLLESCSRFELLPDLPLS